MMNMPVEDNGLSERRVNGFQLGIASCVDGCAPGTLGTRVHQRDRVMNVHAWEAAKPREAPVSQGVARPGRHLADRGEEMLQLGRLTGELVERLRPEKHFVGVADYA